MDSSPKDLAHRYQEPCWVHACAGLQLRGGKALGLGDKASGKKRAVLAGDSKGYLAVCDMVTDDVLARKKVSWEKPCLFATVDVAVKKGCVSDPT